MMSLKKYNKTFTQEINGPRPVSSGLYQKHSPTYNDNSHDFQPANGPGPS